MGVALACVGGMQASADTSAVAATSGGLRREPLPAAERAVIDVYKRVAPAVVSVANEAILRDVFSYELYEVPRGIGSGFLWDKQGHIVSNFHVVYEASTLRVTLRGGTQYEAEVVGVDPDHDIAVLQIKAPPEALTPIPLGTSRDLEVGQSVLAIGNPFGLDASLSIGIVSALGRSIDAMTGRGIFDVIQTDAAINPGNSGGPLLDSAGRLIGMNTAIVSTSGSYAGVGFAVPVDMVRRIVPQLIASGKVQRASLGIQVVPDRLSHRAGIEGVAILSAVAGGPAAKAGLKGVTRTRRGNLVFGDIVVEANGQAVRDSDDLMAILDRRSAGDKVKLVYLRDQARRTAEVTVATQP